MRPVCLLDRTKNLHQSKWTSFYQRFLYVRRIAVPLLKDRAAQRKINDLALEANEKRYEAYRLEQDALKMLNEQIIFAK